MLSFLSSPPHAVMDLLLDAVCIVDQSGRFIYVNAAFERIFGYTAEEIAGRNMIDLVLPEDRARTLRAASDIMAGEPKFSFENRYLRKDGQVVHIMWSARWSENEKVRVAVARDITRRKRAEAMQAAMYAMSEAVHVATDPFGLFALAHRIVGNLLPADQVVVAVRGEHDAALHVAYAADQAGLPTDGPSTRCLEFCRAVVEGVAPQRNDEEAGDLWLGAPLVAVDGCIGAVSLKRRAGGRPFSDEDKDLLHFVAMQMATALERMQLHTRLRRMAQYDNLTGLPNRALLHDRIDTAVAVARRNKGRLALLYLDLDRFKDVNDTLGHAAGDQLLQAVAQRLRDCVRDADTVARLGGDEFVVLIAALTRQEDAETVAEKIRAALAEPVMLEGRALTVSTSIGIARWPENGDGAKDLLLIADAAMYAAKRRR